MKVKSGMEQEYAEYVARNSNDGYSKGTVDFGQKWAELMETDIDAGKSLEEIADQRSTEADKEYGITGFMYGCAVQGLARYWIHGDALRIWHNKQYGVSEEKAKGGTVNPAVFSVGK